MNPKIWFPRTAQIRLVAMLCAAIGALGSKAQEPAKDGPLPRPSVLPDHSARQSPGLPRSSTPDSEAAAKAWEQDAKGDQSSCLTWSASPPGSSGAIVGSSRFFLLARTEGVAPNKGGESASAALQKPYSLFEVSLSTLVPARVLALEILGRPSVIPLGDPPLAVVIVGFSEGDASCASGNARVVTFPLDVTKRATKAMDLKGSFAVVGGVGTATLADMNRRSIQEIDPGRLQSRRATSFLRGDFPVLWEGAKRRLTTISRDAPHKVERWTGRRKPVNESLALERGARLALSPDGGWLVVRVGSTPNSLQIDERLRWSGREVEGSFPLLLQGPFLGRDTAVYPVIPSRMALLMGNSDLTRRRWKKAFVVRYDKPSVLWETAPPPGAYTGFAWLTPDGTKVVAEYRSERSGLTVGVDVTELSSKRVVNVQLPVK